MYIATHGYLIAALIASLGEQVMARPPAAPFVVSAGWLSLLRSRSAADSRVCGWLHLQWSPAGCDICVAAGWHRLLAALIASLGEQVLARPPAAPLWSRRDGSASEVSVGCGLKSLRLAAPPMVSGWLRHIVLRPAGTVGL